jgi:hypothetical protein
MDPDIAAHLGLTERRYRSAETDVGMGRTIVAQTNYPPIFLVDACGSHALLLAQRSC